MALCLRKILFATAGGLLASLLIGSLSAAADDTNLNRFIVAENGNRVLTGTVTSDSVTQAGWYVSSDDALYYYFNDGSYAQNLTELSDGNVYLFAADGTLKTGWQTVEGKRYYYDTEIGQPVYGWYTYLDQLYYIDANAGKLTGEQKINGIPYAFDEYGCVQTGLISYSDGSLYLYDENAVPASGWTTTGSGTYYFSKNGAAMGVTEINGKSYYFTNSGLLQTGWLTMPTGTMWADADGVLAMGATVIDGKSYYFDANGVMQTGLVKTSAGTQYYGKDGVMQTGAQVIDGSIYYFDPTTGVMQTGWVDIADNSYYFHEATGSMQTGWMIKDGTVVYLTDGGLAKGMTDIDGETYYFLPETGAMQTGWQTVNNQTYFFNLESGEMETGWAVTEDGKKYLTPLGLATGLMEIDGHTYYFSPSTNVMQTGWITVNGASYYFDTTTGMMTEIGTAPVQLNVVDYKQFGESWSNTTITYSTIGQVGCLVTTIAMKYSYKTGTKTTPDKMLPKLTFSGDNLQWVSFTNLGYTMESPSGSISQSMMQTIYNQLLKGKPVIVGAKTASGGQHYVVVTGYIGSSGSSFSSAYFVINDPGSSKRTRLNEYLAAYPNIYKIIY